VHQKKRQETPDNCLIALPIEWDLNLYWIKGALFCFSFWLRVL